MAEEIEQAGAAPAEDGPGAAAVQAVSEAAEQIGAGARKVAEDAAGAAGEAAGIAWGELWAELEGFWSLVVDVWQNGVYGVDIGQMIAALLILLLFLAMRRLITHVLLGRIRKFAEKSENEFDDRLVDALHDPIRFVPVVMGVYFALQSLGLEGDPALFAERLVRSLIAFTFFWALFSAARQLTRVMGRLERILTRELLDWLVKALRVGIWLIGAATILEIWGIAVGPIIAGFGLFGVAVALGAQDLFKNLIAGVLILAEKRFRKGDWILVDGVVEGTVEQINFRSTLVRRFDKAPVYVPNTYLSDNAVTNFTKMTYRRIYWKIGVEYRTSHAQLQLIRDSIEAYLLESKDFAKPPAVPTFVRIDAFNASSIDIMVYCFTWTTVWGEWLKIKEALAFRIKQIVEDEAGASFAFPSTSLYVETVPGDRPEPFPLPGASVKSAPALPEPPGTGGAGPPAGETDSREGR